ncbi:cytochrome c biogenesis CcdA family protein [Nonomuraea sp. ZG12]|uniref:cytochrome c biogenesis CcdA family protein n=1 Tax=Nonomuraea sp. ZG12 TaxID=3452207 RepID=UPI003F89C3F2
MGADLPIVLALTAGTLAAFNPCGFAMLPAYLAMLVAGPPEDRPEDPPEDQSDGPSDGPPATVWWRGPVGRAVLLSASMTAGFVTVFGLFGLVVTPLAVSIGSYLPWVTIVIGLALTGLGGWLLANRTLLVRVPKLATGRPAMSVPALYGYGLTYAVASLSCTIGPFLAVISASLSGSGLLGGLAVFVAYALGMGLVVTVLSLAVALARQTAVARLRRVLPYVSRLSGALLVAAGLYVAYYGWYELRVFGGGDTDDPLVSAVTTAQGVVSGWLEALGPGGITLVLAVLLAVLLLTGRRARAGRARD